MRLVSIFIGFIFPTLLGCAVVAEPTSCKENKGYIDRQSLLTLVDLDCDERESDRLCSILLSTPKRVDSREFMLFTFLRSEADNVRTYLNLKPQHTKSDIRVGFEFAESDANQITITSVYENIEGCTLRSSVNLGAYFNEAS